MFNGKSLINRKLNKKKKLITKQNILDKVSQTQIMEFYTGISVSFGKVFCSPFRNDDSPGCKYGIKNGILYFFDYSQDIMWDVFNVVRNKHSLTFKQSLQKINEDLGLGLGGSKSNRKTTIIKVEDNFKEPEKIKYNIEAEKWDKESLSYWKKYGITENTLNNFNVYNTSLVYRNGKFSSRSTKKNPIFTYVLPVTGNCKHYRPLSRDKSKKWWGNTQAKDIFGYSALPSTGETLIITSSLKDVMVAYEAGYSAIAPQSEHSNFDKDLIKDLESRFENIVVIYDNDPTGIKSMKQCNKKYGWLYAIPPAKDIADAYVDLGKDVINLFLKESTTFSTAGLDESQIPF